MSSYPTYEEWKPFLQKRIYFSNNLSSYPTYEEWKLSNIRLIYFTPICSYPTYEEWKLSIILPPPILLFSLLSSEILKHRI